MRTLKHATECQKKTQNDYDVFHGRLVVNVSSQQSHYVAVVEAAPLAENAPLIHFLRGAANTCHTATWWTLSVFSVEGRNIRF